MKSFIYFIFVCLLRDAVRSDEHHPDYRTAKAKPRLLNDTSKDYWYAVAQAELDNALNVTQNTNVAKNVILFLGDGMGVATITAARIYDGQLRGESGEENLLNFEKFPHIGLIKTYAVDKQVPDSAATGTAYLCGVKTNYGTIGVDAQVQRGVCENITADTIVQSIAYQSQLKGKRTGVVTSTRITHATPASLYAHIPDRDWECNTFIPDTSYQNCPFLKDIGRQLVEDDPGKSFNVIMGGGFQELDSTAQDGPGDPLAPFSCIRSDNYTLWQDWLDGKQAAGKSAAFVRSKTELNSVDLTSTEYVMGIFANSHIPYEYEKIELGLDLPTLSEMTEAAITLLSQEPNGYFLLVEGGRIDLSHHDNQARIALDETVAMNQAIATALSLTSEQDTLIVVTADHSHTMTISGYPERGHPITGTLEGASDLLPYTTLNYANGPGYNFSVVNDRAVRGNIRQTNTSDWSYTQQTAAPLGSETHGGEDVAVFALGPMAHLFTGVNEQNFIPYVLAYASCVDDGAHCTSR